MRGKRRIRGGRASFLTRTLFLALFFLCGVCLGQVLSARVPEATGVELTEYLRRYLTLESSVTYGTILSALILYFRYPLLAVLLGYASVGVFLLPVLTAAFGFFLSFSVCCFAATFGVHGILLSLAVFGLRCLISLPCYFLLAVPAWETSMALALASLGKGRRTAPIHYGRGWWVQILICTAVLLVGVCLDLCCSPWLLRLIAARL